MKYDTKESIESSLASYPSFLEMLRIRNDNGYVRNQRMNEWIVFGSVRLDACGNAMHITEPEDPSWATESVYSSADAFMAMKAAGEDRMSSTTGHTPGADLLCPLCGKGWGLNNFWDNKCTQDCVNVDLTPYIGRRLQQIEDLYSYRTDGRWFLNREHPLRNDKYIYIAPDMILERTHGVKFKDGKVVARETNERGYLRKKALNYKGEEIGDIDYSHVIEPGDEAWFIKLTYTHEACYMAKLNLETHAEFTDAFHKAGVSIIAMTEIPNEYGSGSYNGPWYQMLTSRGNFKVGWRKRVIELDYSKIDDYSVALSIPRRPLGFKFISLFESENVTVTENVVHCYGYDKLTEYLMRIKNALAGVV